jgi:general secretion pathway protein B
MSYILDALRKADAERDHGSMPDIYSQSTFYVEPDRGGAQAAGHTKWWAGVVLGIATLTGLAFWWVMRSGDAVLQNIPNTASVVVNAQSTNTQTTEQTPPSKFVAPAPVVVSSASIDMTPEPSAVTRPAVTVPRTPKPVAVPRTPPVTTAAVGSKKPAQTVLTPSELPEDIRRELPAIQVGGSMYSDIAANRVLIINGQALREGQELAPGLVLEQIKLKAAVLSYKGYRYSLSY